MLCESKQDGIEYRKTLREEDKRPRVLKEFPLSTITIILQLFRVATETTLFLKAKLPLNIHDNHTAQ